MLPFSLVQRTLRLTSARAREVLAKEGPGGLVRRAWRRAPQLKVPVWLAWLSLRRRAKQIVAIEDAIAFVYGFRVASIELKPSQMVEEVSALLRLLERDPPRTVVEIGTGWGGTLFLLSRAAAPDALLISVDLPPSEGGYPRWRERLYREFRHGRQELALIRGNSTRDAARRMVVEELDGRMIDFLFIDGDHSYAAVKRDFELYSSLVRPEGLIALHDIVEGDEGLVGDVPRFWKEIEHVHAAQTLIRDPAQGGYGIGLLRLAVRNTIETV